MSLVLSGVLQGAIFDILMADAALNALVGGEIYDAPLPSGGTFPAGEHVTLGEEIVKPFDTVTSSGGVHDFEVTVHSSANGFAGVKAAAGAVLTALIGANWSLSGGHLVSVRLLKARAKRGVAPELRRVEMRFRAVVEEI